MTKREKETPDNDEAENSPNGTATPRSSEIFYNQPPDSGITAPGEGKAEVYFSISAKGSVPIRQKLLNTIKIECARDAEKPAEADERKPDILGAHTHPEKPHLPCAIKTNVEKHPHAPQGAKVHKPKESIAEKLRRLATRKKQR